MAALNFFLQLQALAAVAALLALALRAAARFPGFPLRAGTELKVHYTLFALLGLLSLLPLAGERDFTWKPFAKVMEVRRPGAPGQVPPPAATAVVLEGRAGSSLPPVPLRALSLAALALALLGAAFVARDFLLLSRVLRRAVVVRRIGRVRVAVLEENVSPFSALTPRGAWVVLPAAMLGDPAHARLAILHELQHHRQGDTLFCLLFSPLRAFCFFHPVRALWGALLAEAQELACDEALVSQKKVGAGAYALCLISAAETAATGKVGRAYAAAPSLFSERRTLKRRIESMYAVKKEKRGMGWCLGLALGLCLGVSAWASGSWLSEARVSRAEAERMAEHARKDGDFPVAVNEAVLKELNRFLGTQGGRAFVRKALGRLEELRPRLEGKLAERGLPGELLAVGLIESGFENLRQSPNPRQKGAGIWQFVPSTARIFGLRVDAGVDERLDVDLSTAAAFRYLGANRLRYNDWLLGVMAYNMGEGALDRAIREAGTRDPWELVRRGYENDSGYLPKFMAAVLILKNPEAVR